MLHVWKPLEKGMRLVSDTPGGGRLHRVAREIDYRATEAFFESRGKDAVGQPLVSTMYQDAGLASRRDAAEKETVLPHLAINGADRVLDVGCGAGRWAEVLVPRVAAYLGIDFSEGLLAAARTRTPGGAFQRMSASALDPGAFHLPPPFSLVICSGILIYLNDRDVENLLTLIAEISGPATAQSIARAWNTTASLRSSQGSHYFGKVRRSRATFRTEPTRSSGSRYSAGAHRDDSILLRSRRDTDPPGDPPGDRLGDRTI